jgi:predicted Zn-dependent protease with MMP-like domain
VPPAVTVAGRQVVVPVARTRSERFDDLVRDTIHDLEQRWSTQLAGVEFAVEDVPPPGSGWDEGVVADETAGGPVPLGRLLAAGPGTPARVVVYRRPLEARASDPRDLGELVHEVVVDQVAQLLGLDPDVVDPPHGP